MHYKTIAAIISCIISTQCFATPAHDICGPTVTNDDVFTISASRLRFDYGWLPVANATKLACTLNVKVNTMSPQPSPIPRSIDIIFTELTASADSTSFASLCSYIDGITKQMSYAEEFNLQVCKIGSEYRFLRYFDHPTQP